MMRADTQATYWVDRWVGPGPDDWVAQYAGPFDERDDAEAYAVQLEKLHKGSAPARVSEVER